MARGIVAAGHPHTAAAAGEILAAGGNAFDAVVAAHFAACVAEPVLASLGGGGFLLARTAAGTELLYDFFTHTPLRRRPRRELDFHPILADFGTATQEFHVGMGAIACPGTVKGLFRIQRELGRLPMRRLVEPAVALARGGVRVNALQGYIFDIVGAIYREDPAVCALYAPASTSARLARRGERIRQPLLADTLETLAREGEALFYRGELGRRLVADCRERGGHLTLDDLARYRVMRRRPLELLYRGARVLTNPAPSAGGMLIAFALRLLEAAGPLPGPFGSRAHAARLVGAMAQANAARAEVERSASLSARQRRLLGGRLLRRYRHALLAHPPAHRGTTQISVLDAAGNEASMTVSNGEGSGYAIPGSGVVLNNMLGEEDLHPHGFEHWPVGTRQSSMMAPTLLSLPGGLDVVLGSGGSNRIRSALLQVISHLADLGLPLRRAVASPRLHCEGARLSVEGGFPAATVAALLEACPEAEVWAGRNLFFGGVHAVARDRRRGTFAGAGDPRRGGVCQEIA